MGKILTTLRSNGASPPAPAGDPAPALLVTPPAGEVPEPVGGDGVPFIEIGPRRHAVQASPDVLAATPPAARRPGGVAFRVLPEPKKSKLAPELIAFHTPDTAAARQYAELLTALIEAGRRRPGKCQVLLFTGVRPQAGCTTALLNVAITAARAGYQVAAVDGNLRRPGVAARLALEDAPGLAEVLIGECPLEDALRQTEQEHLTALTAGAPTPVLADIGELEPLVGRLREGSDLVLIDGPPWDGRAACTALAALADVVFLVVPAAEADAAPANDRARELTEQGVPLAGCVLTNP